MAKLPAAKVGYLKKLLKNKGVVSINSHRIGPHLRVDFEEHNPLIVGDTYPCLANRPLDFFRNLTLADNFAMVISMKKQIIRKQINIKREHTEISIF